MSIVKLQIFDPPMCCSSGACGPNIDPKLARFSSDLEWLQNQGVVVERFNLAAEPAAFAQNEVVKGALQYEGHDCLPLLVIDGSIVHRVSYPEREVLAGLCGLSTDTTHEPEVASAAVAAVEAPVCGPGCDCATPKRNRRISTAIGVIALLAVAGILIYKASLGGTPEAVGQAAVAEAGFATGTVADKSGLEPAAPATGASETESVAAAASSADAKTAAGDNAKKSAGSGSVIGKDLNSVNDLNTVAMDVDAVFIFVPSANGDGASTATLSAVMAAKQTLAAKGTKIGLFTLKSSSPEYSAISAQVELPAIFVSYKGRGTGSVTGEVTEGKLLQAYVAASSASAGGCGPSGCGPSGGC